VRRGNAREKKEENGEVRAVKFGHRISFEALDGGMRQKLRAMALPE